MSPHSLVAPYKFAGATALSVESAINCLTFLSMQASTMFWEPIIFVFINSVGLYSAAGTCFNAAEWITISMSLNALSSRSLSLISPKKKRIFLLF